MRRRGAWAQALRRFGAYELAERRFLQAHSARRLPTAKCAAREKDGEKNKEKEKMELVVLDLGLYSRTIYLQRH